MHWHQYECYMNITSIVAGWFKIWNITCHQYPSWFLMITEVISVIVIVIAIIIIINHWIRCIFYHKSCGKIYYYYYYCLYFKLRNWDSKRWKISSQIHIVVNGSTESDRVSLVLVNVFLITTLCCPPFFGIFFLVPCHIPLTCIILRSFLRQF